MTKVFVHIKNNDSPPHNIKADFKFIPRKGDKFSLSVNGDIYEVDYTLFNCFECEYGVEIFAHISA